MFGMVYNYDRQFEVSLLFNTQQLHSHTKRSHHTQNNWTQLVHHWKPEVFITHTHTLHYIIIKHEAIV